MGKFEFLTKPFLVVEEVGAWAKLHDQVDVGASIYNLKQLHNIWVIESS